MTEASPASRYIFSRGAGIGAKQKIRRVAANEVKSRLTAFCVRAVPVELAFFMGALRGCPPQEG